MTTFLVRCLFLKLDTEDVPTNVDGVTTQKGTILKIDWKILRVEGRESWRLGRKSVAERVEEMFDKARLTWHVNLLSDSTQEPEVSFKRHAAHPLHLTSC
jgi:hypothetical protein